MALRRIRINGLRCLREVEVELGAAWSYVFGPNGAGKTSFLEGIYLLGRGRSFRTRQMRRLVRRGEAGLAVFGAVQHPEDRQRKLGLSYSAGRLEKRIDGETASGMAELTTILPVHAIDPSMHALVEGGPSERRRFLDWGVFHVEHQYLDAWKQYRRALSQRNAALKAGRSAAELRPWSLAVGEAGTTVDRSRQRYLTELGPRFAKIGSTLVGRPVGLEYRRGWAGELSLLEALNASETRDRQTGNTELGPHRAELVMRLDDRRLQDEASRGQQKLAAAALILAQVALEVSTRPYRTTLVVDDPVAELDTDSLQRLLTLIAQLPVQTVFTGLTPSQLVPEPGSRVFHVEHGELGTL